MDTLRLALVQVKEWLNWLPDEVTAILILALAAVIALLLHRAVRKLIRHALSTRYPNIFAVFTQMRGITRMALFILAMMVALPVAPLGPEMAGMLARFMAMAIIGLIGWAAITTLHIAADVYLRRFRVDVDDNLLARKHTTQVRVLLRTIDVVLVLFTIGAALMTFPAVRQYGVSLFASAGVAGLVAGLAARPVLSNLFAGVQLAMTQPIRIEDAIIVENEWGNVEEITSTYVVVRLWDWRRMIVPLTYFIEKPFQNWTRESASLIGSVFLYLDYRTPIGILRDKLTEIVKHSKHWDGRVVNLAVTDIKEHTIEVRCLASGRTGGATFDLRCEIREKLIDFLQREHPEALPQRRNTNRTINIAPDGGDHSIVPPNVHTKAQTAERKS